ncbi:hypothetical protein IWX63_003303 [Arthrobacter sp. CAN_A2]|uniref:ice-binding family protein n=1 Tax=Arthrobacter sp. CAN_A2 TaxID=2787718 RepID=UPI001A1B6DAA
MGVITLTSLTLVSGPWEAFAADAPIGLGTAGAYSVLGGQTVTNTGPTRLNADLGVSPGSAVTGFPPGQARNIDAADAEALQAQSDLTIAYNDAAGRAPTDSVAGDLVGQTLQAGVYKSTGPLALSGTLTLDAAGDPDAVFIFQVASTLITASASNVALIGGAQACNVYWQVGSSATLGTNSSFTGSILALTSISVTTNTVVEGRALARDGAVTLDNNTFITSDCAPTPEPTETPTIEPTVVPTVVPTPTVEPTVVPTPTVEPTVVPIPTVEPTVVPTVAPTPTVEPTVVPTVAPTPTVEPTVVPTPTVEPTVVPTPTVEPTVVPTPTDEPTVVPTPVPTVTVPVPVPTVTVPVPGPTVTSSAPLLGDGSDGGGTGAGFDNRSGVTGRDGVTGGTNRGTNIQTAASTAHETQPFLPAVVFAGATACLLILARAAVASQRSTRRH